MIELDIIKCLDIYTEIIINCFILHKSNHLTIQFHTQSCYLINKIFVVLSGSGNIKGDFEIICDAKLPG